MMDRSREERAQGGVAALPESPDEKPRRALLERLAQYASSPATPRTPRTLIYGQNVNSSPFDSPGYSYRQDEEVFLFHVDTRQMRVGLVGEANPRCCIAFSPDGERRTGDWEGSTRPRRFPDSKTFDQWGQTHELWRNDTRALDLGLAFDRLEHVMKDAITNHVLILDGKPKRMMLVLSSLLPHPLLSTLLLALFNLHPIPSSVTLLPDSVMCVVAAGLRSGLVIDIGWHETIITAVYEYREIVHRVTTRGMKLLSWNMKAILERRIQDSGFLDVAGVAFEDVEEIVTRLAWCPNRNHETANSSVLEKSQTIPLRSPTPPGKADITLPFSAFSEPVAASFIKDNGSLMNQQELDDHNQYLPYLAYLLLLRLPIDLRDHFMDRIIISGSGSTIPGLTGCLISEVSAIIKDRGWDPVHSYGSVSASSAAQQSGRRRPHKAQSSANAAGNPVLAGIGHTNVAASTKNDPVSSNDDPPPAHLQRQLDDNMVLSALRSHNLYSLSLISPEQLQTQETNILSPRNAAMTTPRQLRAHHTLGPWAGASLIGGLKVAGTVQITREEFHKHGLNGALNGANRGWRLKTVR